MSSFRNPTGPHSSRVYWRRRALVGAAVVIVVVVVLLIVFGRGGGPSSAAGTASATPTAAGTTATRTTQASAAATPSASASSAPSTAATASAQPSSSAAAASSAGTCAKNQIALKPITDKTAYASTEEPKIAMSITNTGSSACTMDLGSAEQVLTITSGAETYWSSKDCQTGGTHQNVAIKAGQTLTTPFIVWDRTMSSTTTCDSTRPSVSAGGASYHLQVAVGDLTSTTTAQFVLD